jgi:hypothetical protein
MGANRKIPIQPDHDAACYLLLHRMFYVYFIYFIRVNPQIVRNCIIPPIHRLKIVNNVTPLYPLRMYIWRGGGREPSELLSRKNLNCRKEKIYLPPNSLRLKSLASWQDPHEILKG